MCIFGLYVSVGVSFSRCLGLLCTCICFVFLYVGIDVFINMYVHVCVHVSIDLCLCLWFLCMGVNKREAWQRQFEYRDVGEIARGHFLAPIQRSSSGAF